MEIGKRALSSGAFFLGWFTVGIVLAGLFMSAERSRKKITAEIAQLRPLPKMSLHMRWMKGSTRRARNGK
jgi:hypothetical protein